MKRIMIKAGRKTLNRLPHANVFDAIHNFVLFYVAHRRVPQDWRLLNDYFFHLKNTKEIDLAVRQFTSDKLYLKIFVEAAIGPGFTPRTLRVINSFNDVRSECIPDRCIVKPAHLGGVVVYVDKGKGEISLEDLERLRECFSRNLYAEGRERNYRNLSPRLVCEEIVVEPDCVRDYKIFCFEKSPRFIQVDSGRHSIHTRNLYETNWRPIDVTYNYPRGKVQEKPDCLPEMLDLAGKLCAFFESVRVDMYVVEGRIYVGELTHCPEAAHGRFGSVEEERLVSSMYFGASRA